ncbi:hypothetical protein I0P70_07580 [Pontibacter sp. FD36]|uniref:Uncharacterized protein n=1 Tax=Pontibacter lucknowensis TaxID=1077936 RepID=A0A1N6Z3K4_9BACT|nr:MULTISPECIES: hypothetical protein [Pontibacter]EJF09794.1 hypothetical protein O71_12934 [Pontibacter sp. BAB1700]MBF8963100.1 hypothetical protein [Pontibacter sp. FD36]SIR21385.1 hypothetical protein SAMN05421545_2724 [Pontibacter lucknowensis]
MESTTEVHVESARIQKQIENHLGLSGDSLLFEFRKLDNKVRLDLITVNPRHLQSFLFHTEVGYDRVDALRKMWDYVQSYKEKESPYTVQWMARGDKELNTSYFRARNMYEALDKLYFGRDMNTITVFSVVLNPVS